VLTKLPDPKTKLTTMLLNVVDAAHAGGDTNDGVAGTCPNVKVTFSLGGTSMPVSCATNPLKVILTVAFEVVVYSKSILVASKTLIEKTEGFVPTEAVMLETADKAFEKVAVNLDDPVYG
jgi:hypothetical protein